EKGKPTGTKTWVFKADNVRDFSFASSRKFIWDALNPNVEGKRVWAMSLYPKEGNPLWGQYSTRLVAHTLRSYSRRTIAYPYPVAYSVHGPVGGMEYPMISFNGARPEADGTYSVGTKNGLIGVIIHEVGHNFFPMIVNSDERQWSWMDEGLNSFLDGLASLEWDADYPARGITPQGIVPYMRLDSTQQVPIMSSSDNIPRNTFGPNAYSKPATALNILRETVMGRELFDYAFKEYARRWAFKSPEPADFFRTLED
ncbi:M1 family aminopeptidase, partial [Spirosoma pulveris]